MKKYVLLLACLLCLSGCVKNLDNIPALSLVKEQGADWSLEKLTGYSHEQLKEIWGEPAMTLSGFWGEVWYLDEAHTGRITVYYDADGKVENLLLDTAPGLEPAPDPEPESIPESEPVDLTAYEEPPMLNILCGGERLETVSPGYTWVSTMPNGERAVLCACGPHPLDLKERLTACQTAEETALLEFEAAPDEVYIHALDDNCTPECDGMSQTVDLRDSGEIELFPGGYIYEVTAKWGDGETAGGTGTYVFYIDKLYPNNE